MKNNKDETFVKIYQQYYGMVLQICLGFVTGDQETAKDITQEVFVSIWKNLNKFKGLSSYKTWIYRITVNTCLQHLKKEKKTASLPLQDFKDNAAEETNMHNSENNITKLYEAIGQLKSVDRLLILLVLENEEYEAIAEVMGISAINVRVKIHRVKKRIEKILKSM